MTRPIIDFMNAKTHEFYELKASPLELLWNEFRSQFKVEVMEPDSNLVSRGYESRIPRALLGQPPKAKRRSKSKPTGRVNRKWPELDGLIGREYKKLYMRLTRAVERREREG